VLQKTTGIVLLTTKFSESSLIVKIYTLDHGLQSYITSGSRSKKSKNKGNLFQPLALVDIVVSGSERASLKRITELATNHAYTDLPYNIIKSSIALFINEILVHVFREPHPDEDLFQFIKSSLLMLDLSTDNCANFHLSFMLQLSRFLGFYPQGAHSRDSSVFDLQEGRFVNYIPSHPHYLTSAPAALLSDLLKAGYSGAVSISMSRAERRQLLNALVLFYQLHITSFGTIRSAEVLEEINA
jgi:DNA repair protein RecO (recombination protein O)